MKCAKSGNHKLNMKGYCWSCGYESKYPKPIDRFNFCTAHKKCGEIS